MWWMDGDNARWSQENILIFLIKLWIVLDYLKLEIFFQQSAKEGTNDMTNESY